MLDALKKKLGVTQDAAPQADASDAVSLAVSVTDTEEFKQLLSDFGTLKAAHDSLAADLKAATELLDETNAKLTAANEQLATAQAAVDATNAAKAAAEAEAHARKMTARKAAVVDVIGDAKAESFLAATEGLDDAAFQAVASALTGKAAAEATSALFTEVGVDGQVDATNPARTESKEMKLLREKYKGTDAK
jgi:hypothetical protein